MEELREELYKIISDDISLCSEEIVRASQELDNLICIFYKNNNKNEDRDW